MCWLYSTCGNQMTNNNNNNNNIHDRVCAQLHFDIHKEIGVKLDNEHWYDHVSKSVTTSHEDKVTKLWNQKM